jgi:hypothetical protein
MMTLTKFFTATAMVVGLLAYSSQAVLITNLTTETVLFEHTFENANPGDAMTDNPPDIGTYASFVSTTDDAHRIQNAASAGFGANEGEQFVRILGVNYLPGGAVRGNVSTQFAAGAVGDLMEAIWAFRVDQIGDGGSNFLRGGFNGASTGTDIKFWDDGRITHRDQVTGSNPEVDHILTHNVGEWNIVTIRYVNGANFGEISVNGSAFETLFLRNVINVSQWTQSANSGDAIGYIDHWIPEPASLALMGLGGLLMLRRSRS